ncbi:hypothetical protein [Carboxylicivirga taeanensis]|uniref:hypothetical protein n=1 Tax=Carboxylicivirga taeanensis TaxID=1416875 RepID=UPI003F6E1317
MKKVITTNVNYDLGIDLEKNRLHIVCKGFWSKGEIVDQFIAHQKEALSYLKSGFTVVADMREFKTLPLDLVDKQQQSHADLVKAGMFKVAEILPQSAIAKSQLNKVTDSSKMPNMKFSDYAEGEKWLDSVTKN